MRRLVILTILLWLLAFTAAAHAVQLPDPYQGWADQMQVASISGPLDIETTNVPCPTACSLGPGMGIIEPDGSVYIDTLADDGPATTWVNPSTVAPWALYWELGHQFDWRYLTDQDRAMFADLWHAQTTAWWDSVSALQNGTEDGLEATFAADYASCALGYTPQGTVWVQTVEQDPQRVCDLINQIGLENGADMPQLKPTVTATAVQLPTRLAAPARAHHHRRVRWARREVTW